MNYSNNPYGNPYFNPQFYNSPYSYQPVQPRNMQQAQINPQPNQNQQPLTQNLPQYNQSVLQGKSVDSIDVVKATDVNLDGSVCYFPLIDGSAIITKQLQQDGTSKITIYKPIQEEENVPQPKYVTENDLKREIGKIDFSEFNDKFKEIDRKIEDLSDDIKKISKKG